MRALRIVEVSPPNDLASGDYVYRTKNPFSALARLPEVEAVRCITTLHPRRDALMAQADVLILNEICDPDFLPTVKQRLAAGLPTVYEIHDDLTAVQPWNPVHRFFSDEENQRLIYKTASLCSLLQANNRALLERFGHLCQRTALMPNHIWELAPCPPKPADHGEQPLTIGWGGSHGHLEDMKSVAEPLMHWLIRSDGVRLALMSSEPIWRVFESLPESKKFLVPVGTLEDYYRFLGQIDIGFAPLCDTDFNRTRSDVKFIEYAAFGAVAVMQRSRPYLDTVTDGVNGFLFDSPDQLVGVLERLLRDTTLRISVRRAAYAYVRDERLEHQHAAKRLACYASLVEPRSVEHPRADFFAAETEGVTDFERSLYSGLVLMETRAENDEAKAHFRRASHLEPKNYLPHLMLGKIADNPIEELRHALAKNPSSLRARLMLGDALFNSGATREAIESYQAAIAAMPDWETPYRTLAMRMTSLGQPQLASRLIAAADAVAVRLERLAAI